LSNNTITELNLYHNNIGPEGVKYLSDGLKSNNTITTLFLSNNNIGPEGVKHLSEALKSNTTIAYLCLFNNKFGDTGVEFLLEAMKMNYSINQNNSKEDIQYFVGSGQCSDQLQEALELELINQAISKVINWPFDNASLKSPFQKQILEICSCCSGNDCATNGTITINCQQNYCTCLQKNIIIYMNYQQN